jgi:hypothetical protein
VIQHIEYQPTINKFYNGPIPPEKVNKTLVDYRTFDQKATEIIRLSAKPDEVTVNKKPISESDSLTEEGWSWKSLETGGILTVRHMNGNEVAVFGK